MKNTVKINIFLNLLLFNQVRVGLDRSIDKAIRDTNVKAIVICGKGRTFPAGADIREFDQPHKGMTLINISFG